MRNAQKLPAATRIHAFAAVSRIEFPRDTPR